MVVGSLSYKDAGVDIDAGNELVNRIKKLNPAIGGFAGTYPFGAHRNGAPCTDLPILHLVTLDPAPISDWLL